MEKEYRDELTGLYNRRGLYERFADFAEGKVCSLFFLDLDNFKTVNDVYGHPEGDMLLCVIGQIIKRVVKDALAVRLGGDEFVFFVKGERSREELAQITENVFEEIRKQKKDSPGFSVISASVGIVQNASVKEELKALLAKADTALYFAKGRGKACYVFYNDLEEKIKRENEIERMSGDAIANNRFVIRYHPIMHMQTSEIVNIDAYALWHPDDGTVIESKDYRPVFEKTGFIRKFDLYIFERICEELAQLKQELEYVPRVNILLSRISMLDLSFPDTLLGILQKYGITVKDIELSIEESVFGIRGSDRMVEALNVLAAKGFCMAITKFGRDFSSMKYLKSLPIESLRFASTFLNDNYNDRRGRQTIKAFVKMGKEYNLLVIGYGVDTKEKIDFLNGCGCDAMSDAYHVHQFERKDLVLYLEEHCNRRDENIEFRFMDTLSSSDGLYEGQICGENIEFCPGINNEWGALSFPGGKKNTNVVLLPKSVFYKSSYTISMWIKPDHPQILTSVIYMRYLGGFASLMPYRHNQVTSTYRIHEDENVSIWHDASCRSVEPKSWNHVAVSYDAYNGTMRYYINGRKAVNYTGAPVLVACREVVLGGDPFQESYQGKISGLIIYDNVRSDEDIEKLYASFLQSEGFCGETEQFWMENDENEEK